LLLHAEGLYVLEHRLDERLKMSHDDSIQRDPPHTWLYFFATKYHIQVLFNHMRINLRGIPHTASQERMLRQGLQELRLTPDDRLLCGKESSIFFDILYDATTYIVEQIRFCNKTYRRSSEATFTPTRSRRKISHQRDELEPLVGEYGPPHNPTFVYSRENQLVVQVEWFCISVVEKVGKNEFKFDEGDLYAHESIRFERDENATEDSPATAIILCDHIRYPRVQPREYSHYEEKD